MNYALQQATYIRTPNITYEPYHSHLSTGGPPASFNICGSTSANRKVITTVAAETAADIAIAAKAARKPYQERWGLKVLGEMLSKLADLLEANADEFSALEVLDVGKAFTMTGVADLPGSIVVLRYYAGWADKVQGKPIELGPALTAGNILVLKTSELTPLSTFRLCPLLVEAPGFPDGVVNIVDGYGTTAGQTISESMIIDQVAFTGSSPIGHRIMEAAAKFNLKKISLELGGKNLSIIFDDVDLEQIVKWTSGSRIFVHAGIYDKFLKKFTAHVS
ncbi:ALDH-like protein [Rhizopogon salebrosus TDB-379]|nr:ALDH-like protein [Rhizopogon salebrosus TDB-379]